MQKSSNDIVENIVSIVLIVTVDNSRFPFFSNMHSLSEAHVFFTRALYRPKSLTYECSTEHVFFKLFDHYFAAQNFDNYLKGTKHYKTLQHHHPGTETSSFCIERNLNLIFIVSMFFVK